MTELDSAVGICTVEELQVAGKRVVEVDRVPILLLWNGGDPVALHDTCIHRARSLSDGVVFSGRLVCAGHQWAFDLHTGYCAARDRYQPVFPLSVRDGTIYVGIPPTSVEDAGGDSELASRR